MEETKDGEISWSLLRSRFPGGERLTGMTR